MPPRLIFKKQMSNKGNQGHRATGCSLPPLPANRDTSRETGRPNRPVRLIGLVDETVIRRSGAHFASGGVGFEPTKRLSTV